MDEDISRLLKSLPSWINVSQASSTLLSSSTPLNGSFNLDETDQEMGLRTQRETEILIGNFGTQKQIQRVELITDMEHVKSLVCMHESLQWFTGRMRQMIGELPEQARDLFNRCQVQIEYKTGGRSGASASGETVDQV